MKSSKMILLFLIFSGAYAYNNFHGCTLAPDNTTGWVVCLDTVIILKTTNGGSTWQEQTHSATRRFFDVTCVDAMHAWTCGILGEIVSTTDGGTNWVIYPAGGAKYATRIEFIDTSYGWTACGDGAIKKTTDGGGYWETNYTQYFLAEFYGVSFVNPLDGWMVAGWPDTLEYGQGYIMKSTDGGILWDSLLRSSNYDEYLDVFFFNLLDGLVVGGNDSSYAPIILKTTNGGATWNPIVAPANAYYLRAVDFADEYEGWAVGRFGTIIHTSDGGNTWEFQTNPATATLFDVDFSDIMHGLACGYGMILYTANGGQNWNIGNPGVQEGTGNTGQGIGLSVYPNPFLLATQIKFQIPSNKFPTVPNARTPNPELQPTLRIYDATGRLVRSFLWTPLHALSPSYITWSGDDEFGNAVIPGIYFIKLDTDGFQLVEKIIRIN